MFGTVALYGPAVVRWLPLLVVIVLVLVGCNDACGITPSTPQGCPPQ
jgi:hypothetical protein